MDNSFKYNDYDPTDDVLDYWNDEDYNDEPENFEYEEPYSD